MYFVTNSPFSLNANRIIVARPAALQANVDFRSGLVFGSATVNARFGSIAIDDRSVPYDQHSPGDLRRIDEGLLGVRSGSVVISLVSYEGTALSAIVEAAANACQRNPALSVIFATDNADHQRQVSAADACVQLKSDEGPAGQTGRWTSMSVLWEAVPAQWESL